MPRTQRPHPARPRRKPARVSSRTARPRRSSPTAVKSSARRSKSSNRTRKESRIPTARRPPATASRRRRSLEFTAAEKAFHQEILRSVALRAKTHAPGVDPSVVSPPLHVLMVGWEFPPEHSGGLGVHSLELVRELVGLGQRVTFLLPEDRPHLDVPGVVFRAPGDSRDPPMPSGKHPPRPYVSAESGIVTNLKEVTDFYNDWIARITVDGPVDVVHVHDWFGTVGGTQLARRLGTSLVVTIHSTEYDRSLNHPWPEILQREQHGIDHADRVISVSQHLKSQLVERYRADPNRIRVIYNAVRPSEPVEPSADRTPTVIYIGRLAAMKGIDTFLKAAARIAPAFPGVQFVVGGEGPEMPHLLHLAASLGIAERVMFLGRVSEEERQHLLAHAAAFVLPSVVEPFGIAALEAMVAGTPTIVSKTSGVAEVSSSLFQVDFWDVEEFASRIAEVLLYPPLRRTLGSRAREDALREGWRDRAIETLRVYREAMSDRRSP
jgi:glycogen(starch) synthase